MTLDTPGTGKPGYTLAEFEAWCRGEGRGGVAAGRHWSALGLIENFKRFKEREDRKTENEDTS